MGTTARGVPQPAGTDANDAALWLQRLAAWVNDHPGIAVMSTTDRDALGSSDLWLGRVIFNTTVSRPQRYNGTAWVDTEARDRSRVFNRSSPTGAPSSDDYTGTGTLVGPCLWADAPAGQYLVHTTVTLASLTGGVIVSNLAARPAGSGSYAELQPITMMSTGVPLPMPYSHTWPITHPGGDLTFYLINNVGGNSARVYNNATRAIIEYLGPTA